MAKKPESSSDISPIQGLLTLFWKRKMAEFTNHIKSKTDFSAKNKGSCENPFFLKCLFWMSRSPFYVQKANSVLVSFFLFFICFCIAVLFPIKISAQESAAEKIIPADEKDRKTRVVFTEKELEWIKNHPVVRVRISSHYPPFIFMTKEGPKGMGYDYVKTIFQRLGIRMEEVKTASYAEVLEMLKKREGFDLQPVMARSAAREDYIAFTEPYLNFPLVIFTRKEAGFIAHLKDLAGKKVAVERQYIYREWMARDYPDIRILEVGRSEVAIEAVSLGNADAYVGNLAVGTYIIESRGFVNVKVSAPSPYGYSELCMGVRKDWPELAGIINKTLEAMPEEVHNRIRKKWLSVRYEHGLRKSDFFKWILVISMFSLVLLSVVFAWNRSLKDEIQERLLAEERLTASEKRYRALYESSRDGYAGVDMEGRVVESNSTFQDMLGYTGEELSGKTYKEITPVKWHEMESRIIEKQVMVRGYSNLYEKEYIRKDGSVFPIEIRVHLLKDESGTPKGLWAYVRDVTERKKDELKLMQSEQRYRTLVENTLDGYFAYDIETQKFMFLNQRICEVFGYTMEEGLRDLRVWDVIARHDHEKVKQRIMAMMKDSMKKSEQNIYTAIRKDGSTFLAEISSSMVYFQDKTAVQGVLRDVTDKELLQKRLQQSQKLEAIGTLAGGIAHDFNNLLMGIQGNASLALYEAPKEGTVYERLRNIEDCVKDATSLTRQLLGFARGGKYESVPTDLNKLIDKTAKTYGRTKKEIRMHMNLHPRLCKTLVDPGQIEQVLLNLLINAWQAMPGGGELYITTDNVILDEETASSYAVATGDYVRISITDTGIGMDKATMERVFDPFFTTKEMGRGTGLGLSSAYGIVKNHGGLIHVYSQKGQGTTFSVYLPATEQTNDQKEKHKEELSTGVETILLVDDEAFILEVGENLLTKMGYHVITAKNGQEAIEIFRNNKNTIELVILDMIMPEIGGEQVFEAIREIAPKMKVLLSSGYSVNGQAREIIKKGCDGFIQKPYTLGMLSSRIREVLDS